MHSFPMARRLARTMVVPVVIGGLIGLFAVTAGPLAARRGACPTAPAVVEAAVAPDVAVAAPVAMAVEELLRPLRRPPGPPPQVERATVVARLRSSGEPSGHCGVMHVGTLMNFDILSVERGSVRGERIRAIVGCAELPRAGYADGAGTVDRFHAGWVYRLQLSSDPADSRGLVQAPDQRFVVVRADPATPP